MSAVYLMSREKTDLKYRSWSKMVHQDKQPQHPKRFIFGWTKKGKKKTEEPFRCLEDVHILMEECRQSAALFTTTECRYTVTPGLGRGVFANEYLPKTYPYTVLHSDKSTRNELRKNVHASIYPFPGLGRGGNSRSREAQSSLSQELLALRNSRRI